MTSTQGVERPSIVRLSSPNRNRPYSESPARYRVTPPRRESFPSTTPPTRKAVNRSTTPPTGKPNPRPACAARSPSTTNQVRSQAVTRPYDRSPVHSTRRTTVKPGHSSQRDTQGSNGKSPVCSPSQYPPTTPPAKGRPTCASPPNALTPPPHSVKRGWNWSSDGRTTPTNGLISSVNHPNQVETKHARPMIVNHDNIPETAFCKIPTPLPRSTRDTPITPSPIRSRGGSGGTVEKQKPRRVSSSTGSEAEYPLSNSTPLSPDTVLTIQSARNYQVRQQAVRKNSANALRQSTNTVDHRGRPDTAKRVTNSGMRSNSHGLVVMSSLPSGLVSSASGGSTARSVTISPPKHRSNSVPKYTNAEVAVNASSTTPRKPSTGNNNAPTRSHKPITHHGRTSIEPSTPAGAQHLVYPATHKASTPSVLRSGSMPIAFPPDGTNRKSWGESNVFYPLHHHTNPTINHVNTHNTPNIISHRRHTPSPTLPPPSTTTNNPTGSSTSSNSSTAPTIERQIQKQEYIVPIEQQNSTSHSTPITQHSPLRQSAVDSAQDYNFQRQQWQSASYKRGSGGWGTHNYNNMHTYDHAPAPHPHVHTLLNVAPAVNVDLDQAQSFIQKNKLIQTNKSGKGIVNINMATTTTTATATTTCTTVVGNTGVNKVLSKATSVSSAHLKSSPTSHPLRHTHGPSTMGSLGLGMGLLGAHRSHGDKYRTHSNSERFRTNPNCTGSIRIGSTSSSGSPTAELLHSSSSSTHHGKTSPPKRSSPTTTTDHSPPPSRTPSKRNSPPLNTNAPKPIAVLPPSGAIDHTNNDSNHTTNNVNHNHRHNNTRSLITHQRLDTGGAENEQRNSSGNVLWVDMFKTQEVRQTHQETVLQQEKLRRERAAEKRKMAHIQAHSQARERVYSKALEADTEFQLKSIMPLSIDGVILLEDVIVDLEGDNDVVDNCNDFGVDDTDATPLKYTDTQLLVNKIYALFVAANASFYSGDYSIALIQYTKSYEMQCRYRKHRQTELPASEPNEGGRLMICNSPKTQSDPPLTERSGAEDEHPTGSSDHNNNNNNTNIKVLMVTPNNNNRLNARLACGRQDSHSGAAVLDINLHLSTLVNIASTLLMLGKNDECIAMCNKCIAELTHLSVFKAHAYLRRARANRALMLLDDAITDICTAITLQHPNAVDLSRELNLMQVEKKERAMNNTVVDYPAVLGVSMDSSLAEVHKAYKVLAMKWHPDRWVTSGEEEKVIAAETFKRIYEAFQVLSDHTKRAEWISRFRKQQELCTPAHMRKSLSVDAKKRGF